VIASKNLAVGGEGGFAEGERFGRLAALEIVATQFAYLLKKKILMRLR
jgi:hypothetical protein